MAAQSAPVQTGFDDDDPPVYPPYYAHVNYLSNILIIKINL